MERTPEAFFELVIRENERGLRAFLTACVHDSNDADELFQEVFLAAWSRLDRYDTARPFGHWLRGVARHKVLEYYRNAATQRRHVRPLPPEAVTAISDAFEHLTVGRAEGFGDCMKALHECLAALPARDAELVRQLYHQEQTCGAAAARLGDTAEAVKKRIQRIRRQLRDCITAKLGPEAAHG